MIDVPRIVRNSDGSGFTLSAFSDPGNGYYQAAAVSADNQGNLVWDKIISGTFEDVVETADNGFAFIGYFDLNYLGVGNYKTMHLAKVDRNGTFFNNFILGNISRDLNLNCIVDQNEQGFDNWLVKAQGNTTFYSNTDSLGNYKFDVDTGAYNISVVLPGPLWSSCMGTVPIQVNLLDSIISDFPIQPLVNCPYLTLDISVPFLRRCFPNVYTVNYCNYGTIASPNTEVEIEFHPHLDVISSDIPWTSQIGNTFTFPVGNIAVNDCGSFKITVIPVCDSTIIGQTLCASATITPDTICTPTDPLWDGSITDLEVNCGTDSLTFTITNIGAGNMNTPLEYLVIEDHLIGKQGVFQLNALESMQLKFPANGSTYRLYAGQSPGYFPPAYHPTIANEGCGTNVYGTYSTGFINMFPENDILNTEAISCHEAQGSFDPNDKQAVPTGYGTEHYIEAGDDLKYYIRFQNTGTDTAFTVVIRDTISEHLDIATLLHGASSHPYDLTIISGNVLKYTFNNILLPDSTTNEPLSHGFVKFKISQQPNLPLGTTINNTAAIYFDFNEPVITNETYHEIGEDFIPVVVTSIEPSPEHPLLTVNVRPNPFVHYAEFVLENAPYGLKTLELYDAMGRQIRMENFSGENHHLLDSKGLSQGIYFYKIKYKNQLLVSGKLIAGI